MAAVWSAVWSAVCSVVWSAVWVYIGFPMQRKSDASEIQSLARSGPNLVGMVGIRRVGIRRLSRLSRLNLLSGLSR